jgi:voltage-gated potassium channel
VSTITTVGYGDVYPVTTAGRIIATIIMFAGIGILGTFISTVGVKLISNKMRRNIPSIGDDAKELIKGRIDKIERLSENDFELLIRMLTDLHNRRK